MSDKLTFRRIRGRIVPIKMKTDKVEGSALVVAGAALGVVAGKSQKVVDRLVKQNLRRGGVSFLAKRRFERTSVKIGQQTLDGFVQSQKAIKFGSASVSYLKNAQRILKASIYVRPALISVAGAAATAGFLKLSNEKNKEAKAAKSAALGSAVAGTAFATGFVGKRHLTVAFKKLFKAAI